MKLKESIKSRAVLNSYGDIMKIRIEQGSESYVCTCGASSSTPLCDGSHNEKNEKENASYKPLKVSSDNDVELDVDSGNY